MSFENTKRKITCDIPLATHEQPLVRELSGEHVREVTLKHNSEIIPGKKILHPVCAFGFTNQQKVFRLLPFAGTGNTAASKFVIELFGSKRFANGKGNQPEHYSVINSTKASVVIEALEYMLGERSNLL